MRVVTVIENTAAQDKLFHENGLCLYVEYMNRKILIGTGESAKAAENARRMKLDLEGITDIVIPHNHYSVTGGLDAFMRFSPNARIFVRQAAKNDFYVKPNLFKYRIGDAGGFFKHYKKNIILYSFFSEICEGFYLTGVENPDEKYVNAGKLYYKKEGSRRVLDNFAQESFCVVFPSGNRRDGAVIVTAGGFSGAVNMIESFRLRYPESPIMAVIGGFNLMKTLNHSSVGDDFITGLAQGLDGTGISEFYTCFNTGFAAFDVMDKQLKKKLHYIGAGEELTF